MNNDITIEDIERLAKQHADDRAVLADRVQRFEDKVRSIKRLLLPGIKTAAGKAKASREQLVAAVERSPQLFKSPRSRTLHNIKVGYQKGKGRLQTGSDLKVVAAIRKHFPDDVDLLIIQTEKPDKKALAKLSSAELRKLGCDLVGAGDAVIVKPVDSEIEKMVDALIDDKEAA